SGPCPVMARPESWPVLAKGRERTEGMSNRQMGELGRSIQDTYDWIVVGSGAGAVVSGLLARRAGLTCLVLEKEDKVGGSTALSGGVVWIPTNSVMREAGIADSHEEAAQYLNACAGEPTPGSTIAQREAYLRN